MPTKIFNTCKRIYIFFYYRFDPKGQEITTSQKYSVNTSVTASYSILKINNIGITDAGDYILEAKNDYTIKKLNFTLDVIGIQIIL